MTMRSELEAELERIRGHFCIEEWREPLESIAHRLEDILARHPEPRWIPVGEKLPVEERDVLVYNGSTYVAGLFRGRWLDEAGQLCGVTHWRELPEEP